MAGQQQPAVGVGRPGELIEQTGLADAWLADARDHLTMPRRRADKGLMELFQLRSTPTKCVRPRATACNRERTPSGLPQLVNLDGLRQPLRPAPTA